MGKHFRGKFPLVVSLLLICQLILPMTSASAATTSTSQTTTTTATTGTLLPPSNLASQMTTPSDVKLTWSSVYGASGYNVYQITDGSMQLLGTTTSTSYTINNLAQGSYQYVVSTLNGGSESGPCAPVDVSVTYPTMAAPATLTNTIANGNDIVLSWGSSQYAQKYNLYSIAADGTQTLVTSTTSRTYTITNSPAGSFTFAVTAVHSLYGESALSTPLNVNLTYPTMAAPANLKQTIANGNDITLSWSSSSYATNYNVYQVVDGQKSLLSTVTGTSVTYSNQPAGDYTYEVHSNSSRFGESADGSQVSFTLAPITMAAPANLKDTIGTGNNVTLSWSSVTYATSYNVYQVVNGQNTLVTTVTGTSATLKSLPAGDYTYEVHSNSSRFGESPSGSQVSFTVSQILMAAPSNLNYTLSNGNNVTLSWSSVPYATSYNIYQVANGQNTLVSTVSGTSVTYSNLANGDYTYEVHSNSGTYGESADGSQVSFSIGATVMAAPDNFAYTIQNGNDIALTWNTVSGANSYKVYQIVNGQKVLKSTVTGTSVTYTNVAAGDYTYEVHAYSSTYGESPDGASQVSLTVVYPTMVPPANVVQSVKDATDFSLRWDAAPYATSYKVYLISNGTKTLKQTVTTTSASFSNVVPGDYTYEVHAVSSRFGESADGTQITFTMNGQTMQPPTNLAYSTANINDITLKWTAAQYATSYKIYQVVNGQPVLKSTVTGTSVTYTNQPGGDYDYIVDSVSSTLGESPTGAEVTFTLTLPTMAAPANLAYTIQSGNNVVLTWSSVQYATSYKVYELVDGQEMLKTTVSGLTATLSNVPIGDHTYVVHASSTRFGDSDGSQLDVTLNEVNMQAPTNFTQSIANGNDIVLKWDAATYATAYKVYQVVDGQLVLKSTVTGTTVTYTNQPEGDYTYEVHSYSDRFGESPAGNSQVSFTLVFPDMTGPANLTQAIANGNDITLKWNAVTYATSYKVYQVVNGQLVLKSTVTGTTVTYTNQPAGDYTYEVHSYSNRFGESPVGSSEISFPLVFPTMQPPTNLTQTVANGNDITLKWTASQYATSYNVYQITNGQKVLKSTVSGTSVTYTNQPAGDYTFEVHAVSSRFGESPSGSTTTFTLVWPVVQPPTLTGTVANANNLTMNWNSVTWANEYHVYEVTDGTATLVYKGTALKTTLYNLSQATHTYEVMAYNTRFGESAPSNVLTEPIVYPVMQPPVASVKLLTTNSAQLSWTFATYANGYNIYEIVDGQAVSVAKNINNLSYTLTNLSYANHQYYVTSYSNSFGESVASNTVVAQLIVDTTPPVTTASAPTTWTNKSATVTLSATDDITGVAGTYYSVNGSPFVSGTSVTLSDEGDNKVSYYSVDKVGNTEATQTIDVRIDKTAPISQASSVPAWSNGPQTITLSATDALSGVANTYYSVNGSDPVAGNAVTVDQEGTNRVTFYSIDNAGNQEQAQTITVNIDKTAPVTTATAPNDWSKSSVTVNFAATDAQSGVANTYYSVNGSDYVAGTNASIGTEGDNQVSFYSVDNAGNKEPVQTIQVKVDKTAPTTTPNLSSNEGQSTHLANGSDWTNQDVTVSLAATDALSGVASTYYSIDGSDYVAGTSFTVSGEGVHKVSYYSVDNVGNQEQAQTIEVKIDKTAPVTSSDAQTAWTNQDVTVNLSATDALSGVASTYYSIDGSDYVAGTQLTISTEGTHKVTYYSVDNAGNQEQAQTVVVNIDKTAPVTTSDAQAAWTNQDVTVNFSATDALSGVANTYYSVDGSSYAAGTSVTITSEGVHTITYYSVDNAGNTEATETATVKVDKSAPTVTLNVPSEIAMGTKQVLAYTATDSLSGVANQMMTVYGPLNQNGQVIANGGTVNLLLPGNYRVVVNATDAAGNTTTITKQFVVYIPVNVTVTAKMIKPNKGEFTVRVDLPLGYSTSGFDLNSVTLDGVKALNDNNGYYNQAKLGQFKFDRDDFTWTGTPITMTFRGYVGGYLVIGTATVNVQK